MYYLYVLFSIVAIKSYVGITENPERQLKQHNEGKSYFTNRYRPWVLIFLEEYNSKGEAVIREKFLKSRSGRRWLKKEIFSELN